MNTYEQLIDLYKDPAKIPVHNLLFVDVDGVLNNHIDTQCWQSVRPISKQNVTAFNSLLEYLKNIEGFNPIKCVLSSTWRLQYFKKDNPIEEINKDFSSYGLKTEFIGYTPRLISVTCHTYPRGYEVDYWIKRNCPKSIVHFAILDDDRDMADLSSNLVHVCGNFGLHEVNFGEVAFCMRKKVYVG